MERKSKKEGLYVYIKLIHFGVQQKHNIVKQQYSNENLKKKLKKFLRECIYVCV